MKPKPITYSIKELKILEDDNETGVFAISFVDMPAIETNFEYFAANKRIIRNIEDITVADLDHKYKWIVNHESELENNVCPVCIEWGNHKPMKLREWIHTALPRVQVGTQILDMTATGAHEPYNTYCEGNCGCHLEAVEDLSQQFSVQLSIEDVEKREVVGLVLRSGQFIYRHNVGNGPGYVFFSRDTVLKMYKKFGYNRTVTHSHQADKTGSVIMMRSWIEDGEKDTQWKVRYKVLDNKLWEDIKNNVVRGFSLEGSFI